MHQHKLADNLLAASMAGQMKATCCTPYLTPQVSPDAQAACSSSEGEPSTSSAAMPGLPGPRAPGKAAFSSMLDNALPPDMMQRFLTAAHDPQHFQSFVGELCCQGALKQFAVCVISSASVPQPRAGCCWPLRTWWLSMTPSTARALWRTLLWACHFHVSIVADLCTSWAQSAPSKREVLT